MLKLPPLSIYVHIPWCEKKCPYCDFNSHVSSNTIPESEYIDKLLNDLNSQLKYVQDREVQSIFIGGGTPSLFAASSIKRILDGCSAKLAFSKNIEITMEANPGSSDQQKFADLIAAGVNRLSLGIQSFNQQHLSKLGRVHNSSEALSAVNAAKIAGFKRINIDLMHGLPEQSVSQACADLQQAIDLDVEHISWYQLTIEQNTEFFRYPPTLPLDDTLADIQDSGLALLESNGFKQYEISAFCKNAQMAKHNINYWQFGDYLAIGAGAHGKITLAEKNTIIRFNNTRLPKDYLSRSESFVTQEETLSKTDQTFESLMNCLRLNDGMNLTDFLYRTDSTLVGLMKLCQPLIKDGLIEITEHIKATPLGRRYLNTVLERLIDSDIIISDNNSVK